jgi:TolA-binding protein
MKKTIIIVALLLMTNIFASEPSAFKAGDLDNPNPYGLTTAEKKIVEQNKNLQTISQTVFDSNQTQIELRNELEGIKSLLGGINENQFKLIEQIESDKNGSLKNANKQIDSLSKKLEENFKLQNENYDKIMATLAQMAKMMDEFAQNYVSKEQLKLNMGKNYKEIKSKDGNKTASEQGQKKEETNTTKTDTNTTETNATIKKEPLPKAEISDDELFKQAEKAYKSNKNDEAKIKLTKLIEKKYAKKAIVNFYLGEIEYKSKNFKEALNHFQESIDADDKSSFLPLMLFHSALSLEKLGDKPSAKKILESMVKTYPNDARIPAAKKKLSEY